MKEEIYLDYNATTPTAPEVVEAMLPYFNREFGNPASGQHAPGRRAADSVDTARRQVAALVGVEADEIVFTSGASEANNLVLKGVAAVDGRRRVVVGATEHKAILDTADWLAHAGVPVAVATVDSQGRVDPAVLEEILSAGDTSLVSIMAANNETGTLNAIDELAVLAHRYGALFHTDATQQVGKLPIGLDAAGVDFASFSAHKLYGPKGVGGLYVRRQHRRSLVPLIHGGGHERGLRSGTTNVPGVVGFGAACQLAGSDLTLEAERLKQLRDRLHARLADELGGVQLNGPAVPRLPNTLNIRIAGADAEAVIANLPDVAVATGSACTSAVPSPSHVLLAMGLDNDAAGESLRMSLGRPTTHEEIDRAAGLVARAVGRVRELTGSLT